MNHLNAKEMKRAWTKLPRDIQYLVFQKADGVKFEKFITCYFVSKWSIRIMIPLGFFGAWYIDHGGTRWAGATIMVISLVIGFASLVIGSKMRLQAKVYGSLPEHVDKVEKSTELGESIWALSTPEIHQSSHIPRVNKAKAVIKVERSNLPVEQKQRLAKVEKSFLAELHGHFFALGLGEAKIESYLQRAQSE